MFSSCSSLPNGISAVNLAWRLESEYLSAAALLLEELEETLTVMRLDLLESLERVISSTNLIKNLFSRVCEVARRVNHWQGGMMIRRWTAAGVLEAERHCCKAPAIERYRSWPQRCVLMMPQSTASVGLIISSRPPKY
jgi:hypothetical protein